MKQQKISKIGEVKSKIEWVFDAKELSVAFWHHFWRKIVERNLQDDSKLGANKLARLVKISLRFS